MRGIRRAAVRRLALGPLLSVAFGLMLVGAVSVLPGGWGMAYSQTVPGNDNEHSNAGGAERGLERACDVSSGRNPHCSGTEHPEDEPFTTSDNALTLDVAGGAPVDFEHDAVDLTLPGPAAPEGIREFKAVMLGLQPDGTPNDVTLVLHYTDEELGELAGPVQVFCYEPLSGRWVELDGVVDPVAHTVTIEHVDVSAFANGPIRLSLFGHTA